MTNKQGKVTISILANMRTKLNETKDRYIRFVIRIGVFCTAFYTFNDVLKSEFQKRTLFKMTFTLILIIKVILTMIVIVDLTALRIFHAGTAQPRRRLKLRRPEPTDSWILWRRAGGTRQRVPSAYTGGE
jgi:hypothetical protein